MTAKIIEPPGKEWDYFKISKSIQARFRPEANGNVELVIVVSFCLSLGHQLVTRTHSISSPAPTMSPSCSTLRKTGSMLLPRMIC